MNSTTKDLITFSKQRGLPVVYHRKDVKPFTVQPKLLVQTLTQERYDWSITLNCLKVYEAGYAGPSSPEGKRRRAAAKAAGLTSPVEGSASPEAGPAAQG